ncbi:YodC family protein [Bradyrhizobium sp.]|uniref:YodC family protein n=1 Tax=Bradyrhizobium sp. TaxID=376 RepID=UPI003BAE5605
MIALSSRADMLANRSFNVEERIMHLKPGDVVMLKSGGHPVTVAEVNDDTVECLWMGDHGDLFRETFPIAVLELAGFDDSVDGEEEEEQEDDDEDDIDEDDPEEDDTDEDDDDKDKVA